MPRPGDRLPRGVTRDDLDQRIAAMDRMAGVLEVLDVTVPLDRDTEMTLPAGLRQFAAGARTALAGHPEPDGPLPTATPEAPNRALAGGTSNTAPAAASDAAEPPAAPPRYHRLVLMPRALPVLHRSTAHETASRRRRHRARRRNPTTATTRSPPLCSGPVRRCPERPRCPLIERLRTTTRADRIAEPVLAAGDDDLAAAAADYATTAPALGLPNSPPNTWDQAVITEQHRRADMATATAGLPAHLQADMEAAGRARAAEAAALARSEQMRELLGQVRDVAGTGGWTTAADLVEQAQRADPARSARMDGPLATYSSNAAEAARTDAPTVPDDAAATTVDVDGQAAAQQTPVDETARRHAQILAARGETAAAVIIRGMSEDDLLGLEAHYARGQRIIPGPPLERHQMVVGASCRRIASGPLSLAGARGVMPK